MLYWYVLDKEAVSTKEMHALQVLSKKWPTLEWGRHSYESSTIILNKFRRDGYLVDIIIVLISDKYHLHVLPVKIATAYKT